MFIPTYEIKRKTRTVLKSVKKILIKRNLVFQVFMSFSFGVMLIYDCVFFLFSDTEAGFTVFGELPIPHFVPMALKTRTYPLLIIHYHISFYL